jgi:hypothetical protein
MPYPLVAVRGGLGQGGVSWSPTFSFKADWGSSLAADIGVLTTVDTNSKMTVSGGKLNFATGGVGAGDPGAWGQSHARAAGLLSVAEVTFSAAAISAGWDNGQSGATRDAITLGAATNVIVDGTSIAVAAVSTATSYKLATVLRSTGAFYLMKGGAFTNWSLLYVGNFGTAAAFPVCNANTTTAVGSSDFLRACPLPSPWDSDYGVATARNAGAQSAGLTFTHDANGQLDFTLTTRPSASNVDFRFRSQDSSNYWQVTIDSTGAITLNEVVAGSPTQRGTAAAVVLTGHRVTIRASGTEIRVFSNNVLRITYASASNFATSTSGTLTALGTGGAVSDVVLWPIVIPAVAAAYLDLAMA